MGTEGLESIVKMVKDKAVTEAVASILSSLEEDVFKAIVAEGVKTTILEYSSGYHVRDIVLPKVVEEAKAQMANGKFNDLIAERATELVHAYVGYCFGEAAEGLYRVVHWDSFKEKLKQLGKDC